MHPNPVIAATALSAFLAACATPRPQPYQAFDGKAGYLDVERAEGTYLVIVYGELTTDTSLLREHLARRARELCGSAPFDLHSVRELGQAYQAPRIPTILEQEGHRPIPHRSGTLHWVEAEVRCAGEPVSESADT